MRTADAVAIAIPPLLLRIVLAITFIWAGMAKLAGSLDVGAPDEPILVAMNVTPERVTTVQPDGTEATAVRVQRLYGLAIQLHRAAYPEPRTLADGTAEPVQAIWPAWAVKEPWPVFTAFAVAVTELVAGLFLLIGFLTRLAGLAVAATMLAAAWLTEIGPAIQSGDTLLGFLPDVQPWYDVGWMPLFWQMAIFAMGLALVFAGGGALSIDRAVAHRHDDDDADDDHDDDHA